MNDGATRGHTASAAGALGACVESETAVGETLGGRAVRAICTDEVTLMGCCVHLYDSHRGEIQSVSITHSVSDEVFFVNTRRGL